MLEIPRLVRMPDARLDPCPPRAPEGAEAFEAWRPPGGGAPFGASWRQDGTWVVVLEGIARFRFAPGAAEVEATARPGLGDDALEDQWLRQVLPLAVQAAGTEVLHAGAVDLPAGVVAFTGHAGAGKSTLVWSLGTLGVAIWSDDALAFTCTPSGVETISLPYRVRLRPDVLAAEGTRKRVVARSAPDVRPRTRPLRAIVFVAQAERAEDIGRLAPADAHAVFPALLGQAWGLGLADPDARRRLVERYLALAAGVPLFTWTRGTELESVQPTTRGLLASLRSALS